tara:strand:+ start:316 stop:516 length:201 start_codon:yes stop_codon:yes gene_type:complete
MPNLTNTPLSSPQPSPPGSPARNTDDPIVPLSPGPEHRSTSDNNTIESHSNHLRTMRRLRKAGLLN